AALFGAFRDDGPAIEQESVHHLEKLVDGAPLRRPWWYFDVRVQGSGLVDIPTHVVDQAQWLVDSDAAAPVLLSARAWSTRVPAEAFRRITGEAGFPRELEPFVDGDALNYRCNAELVYRIGHVTARAATRWNLSPSPGGGDASHSVAHGTRADVRLEQSARTDYRRRVFLEPRTDAAGVERALRETVTAWQADRARRGPGPPRTAADPAARRRSVADREHPDDAALRHLRLRIAERVQARLHALRIDPPARLHGDVLHAVDGEGARHAGDAGVGLVLPDLRAGLGVEGAEVAVVRAA